MSNLKAPNPEPSPKTVIRAWKRDQRRAKAKTQRRIARLGR